MDMILFSWETSCGRRDEASESECLAPTAHSQRITGCSDSIRLFRSASVLPCGSRLAEAIEILLLVPEVALRLEAGPTEDRLICLPGPEAVVHLEEGEHVAVQHVEVVVGGGRHMEVGYVAGVEVDRRLTSQQQIVVDERHAGADACGRESQIDARIPVDAGVDERLYIS